MQGGKKKKKREKGNGGHVGDDKKAVDKGFYICKIR